MYCETSRAGRRSHGGPCCRAKQAAQAAEVIVKITGPSAKIATAMATMATAMATTSAKPSMRGVLGLRRANALVLLDDGMSCEAIAKVLLLDDDTIRT